VLYESDWQDAPRAKPFVHIEGSQKPLPEFETIVKMLWDDDSFYIAAQLADPHIWATLKQRDTIIFQNNDFEVFMDPDGDTHNYIELEINALNTVWDLILLRPYREDDLPKVNNAWDIKGLQTAVHVDGTLNDPSDIDSGWTVEIAIPWSSIIEFASPQNFPSHGDQWRINFSRVAWHTEIIDDKYFKINDSLKNEPPYFPQENWVWSAQGAVAMHQPETWGYVQFSKNQVGTVKDSFNSREEEKIKWAIRQLYFQQKAFYQHNTSYGDNIKAFTVPEVGISDYHFSPEFTADSTHFTIRASGLDQDGYWKIRQDGKVWYEADL
jgi:hypothetical protein